MFLVKQAINIGKWWNTLHPFKRGSIILSIPTACLLIAVGLFTWLSDSTAENEKWVKHTQSVQLTVQVMLRKLIDAETGARGYILTGRYGFLYPYHSAVSDLPDITNSLKKLIQDNPQQEIKFRTVEELIQQTLNLLAQQIQATDQQLNPSDKLDRKLDVAKAQMDKLRASIEAFVQEEQRLLYERQEQLEYWRNLNRKGLIVSLVIGMMGSGVALHLLYQLQKELFAKEKDLVSAYENLSRFTANASHELRAPLAAILSNAQVGLLAQEDVPQTRHRLEKIVHIAKSMADLINDLLFLARLEGTVHTLQFIQIDLRSFTADFLQEWRLNHPSVHTWHCHLPDFPVIVKGDESLLKQVLTNLLSNAQRYTPPNGEITVSLTPKAQWVLLAVADTGVGIAPEAVPHIFERFYREEKARSICRAGFGLGLAIAHQIVKVHHGDIGVTSEVNRGSTFTVKLPYRF